MVQKGLRGDLYHDFYQLLKAHNIFFQHVPAQALNRITRKNHQGVVAFLSPISYANLEAEIPFLYEQGKTPFVLLLDRITDVRNFGAIARTAECSGVDIIVIPSRGAAIINEDAIKTSAGALHKIKVARVPNMVRKRGRRHIQSLYALFRCLLQNTYGGHHSFSQCVCSRRHSYV